MEDRRKSKRLDLEVAVQFKRLDKGEVTTISYIHVKVTDMSRSGIGFSAEHELEVGSYYETKNSYLDRGDHRCSSRDCAGRRRRRNLSVRSCIYRHDRSRCIKD